MIKLGSQIFTKKYKESKFEPITNSSLGVKPKGGLWTSTFNKETGGGWLEWCKGENWYKPMDKSFSLLYPQECRVYEIDSAADLLELIPKYENTKRPYHSRFLNFEKLAGDFDAIHLTENGQGDTRFSAHNIGIDLYGWDCECTLWLRPMFKKVKRIPRKRKWFNEQFKEPKKYPIYKKYLK